jgi:hypothetical protein
MSRSPELSAMKWWKCRIRNPKRNEAEPRITSKTKKGKRRRHLKV